MWPSISAGAQQSSLISHGTAWDVRGAPCFSDTTVNLSQQLRERSVMEDRKRPSSRPLHAVRATQVQAPHRYMLSAGLLASAVLRG